MKSKKVSLLLVMLFMLQGVSCAQSRAKLKTYKRVRTAYSEKFEPLKKELKTKGIDIAKVQLLLVSLKKEEELQVWVRNKGDKQFLHLKNYEFCSNSGELGPKRKQGDMQIPEGLYHISYFNPWSNFHLSMKVNYPNRSDKIRGLKGSLGNNIFIHGDCVTIGCIPITDSLIKELFVLAVEAHQNGKVQVLMLPSKFSKESINSAKQTKEYTSTTIDLWEELLPIYQHFKKNKTLPSVKTNNKGAYYIVE